MYSFSTLYALGELAGLAKSNLGEGSLPQSDFKGCVLGEYISMGEFPSQEPQCL